MADRDELDTRIRSLEAERLRPVPPPPTRAVELGPPRYADLPQLVREMAGAEGRHRRATPTGKTI